MLGLAACHYSYFMLVSWLHIRWIPKHHNHKAYSGIMQLFMGIKLILRIKLGIASPNYATELVHSINGKKYSNIAMKN